MPEMINIRGFSIESTDIEIDAEEYESAKADETLDLELDVYLSDMDGETVIVEPSGKMLKPFDVQRSGHMIDVLRKALDATPLDDIEAYVAKRKRG